MNNPVVDVCQGYCVVYDKNGSEMVIFNEKGKVGNIQTNLPILKVRVASQGWWQPFWKMVILPGSTSMIQMEMRL